MVGDDRRRRPTFHYCRRFSLPDRSAVVLIRKQRAWRYGSRRGDDCDLAGRDALYVSQQLGPLHSVVTAPCASTLRTTRQPKRMLSRVDESESSSLGGG